MMVRLLGPDDPLGTGLLLLEREDFSYDAYMYQPALRRVRRISVTKRRGPFSGTDVSFEDLEAKRASQWRPQMLRSEELAGRPAFVLEVLPGEVPSGYERIVAWFDQQLPIMLRAEFYRDGRRLKEMHVDPQRIREMSGYQLPERMVFRGPGGSDTSIDLTEVEVRPELGEELFTRSALEFRDEDMDARRR